MNEYYKELIKVIAILLYNCLKIFLIICSLVHVYNNDHARAAFIFSLLTFNEVISGKKD